MPVVAPFSTPVAPLPVPSAQPTNESIEDVRPDGGLLGRAAIAALAAVTKHLHQQGI